MSKHIVETVRSKFDNHETVLPEDVADLLEWAEKVLGWMRSAARL